MIKAEWPQELLSHELGEAVHVWDWNENPDGNADPLEPHPMSQLFHRGALREGAGRGPSAVGARTQVALLGLLRPRPGAMLTVSFDLQACV